MGIYVHKVLGYGLTDVEYDREHWKLTDPRFKRNCALSAGEDGDEARDDKGRFGPKAWEQFLEAKKAKYLARGKNTWIALSLVDLMLDRLKNPKKGPARKHGWLPIDCIHHQPEFGKSEILVIEPPVYSMMAEDRWSRYNDAIDYVEETTNHEQRPRLEVYRWQTLYPFVAWVDARTGRRLGYSRKHEDVMAFVWHIDYLTAKFRDHAKPDKTKDKLIKKIVRQLGFKSVREAYQNIIPEVPGGVELLCEFLNLFRKKRTALQLRPMLYVYWA